MMDSGDIRDLIYGLMFLTVPIIFLLSKGRAIRDNAGSALLLIGMLVFGSYLVVSAVRRGKAK